MLPLRLFGSRERTGAHAARLLFLGGMVGFWFFTTQYLQGVLHATALGRACLAAHDDPELRRGDAGATTDPKTR